MNANNLRYTNTHEWIESEDGNIVIIGVTDFVVLHLGVITYIELPTEGENLAKGTICGVIESLKAAFDIYAPVSGTVVAVNTTLQKNPDLLKKDAYESGWMIKVCADSKEDFKHLMNADKYKEYIGRYKESGAN